MSKVKPELAEDLENLVILSKNQSTEQTTKHLYCLVWAKIYRDDFSTTQGVPLKFRFPSRKVFQYNRVQNLLKLVEKLGGEKAILEFNWRIQEDDEE